MGSSRATAAAASLAHVSRSITRHAGGRGFRDMTAHFAKVGQDRVRFWIGMASTSTSESELASFAHASACRAHRFPRCLWNEHCNHRAYALPCHGPVHRRRTGLSRSQCDRAQRSTTSSRPQVSPRRASAPRSGARLRPQCELNGQRSADFKGQFLTAGQHWCYPLTVMGHASRYLLGRKCLDGPKRSPTQAAFERLLRCYGLPDRLSTDTGVPFASTGCGELSQLSIW